MKRFDVIKGLLDHYSSLNVIIFWLWIRHEYPSCNTSFCRNQQRDPLTEWGSDRLMFEQQVKPCSVCCRCWIPRVWIICLYYHHSLHVGLSGVQWQTNKTVSPFHTNREQETGNSFPLDSVISVCFEIRPLRMWGRIWFHPWPETSSDQCRFQRVKSYFVCLLKRFVWNRLTTAMLEHVVSLYERLIHVLRVDLSALIDHWIAMVKNRCVNPYFHRLKYDNVYLIRVSSNSTCSLRFQVFFF